VLRPDGSIHDVPGYDPVSRIIYDPSGTAWPLIPQSPTRADAQSALATLADPFCDFPFVAECDRYAMIAFVLTVLARSAIDGNVPLFGVSANTPGSGKGLGVEVCSIIATGENASHMTPVNDDNEMRKRLFAIAIAAPRLANIDNVDTDLGCASLDAALTASSISDRVLGVSEIRSVPLTTVFSATGNNLSYRGDLARRVVPIEIDPGVEHPEDRAQFKYPRLQEHVRTVRPTLVVAALTLLRAFMLAGKPPHGAPLKGSFEGWDRLVRGAIVWAGGTDPLGGVERLRQRGDASLERITALLAAWSVTFGSLAVTVAEAMRRATEGSELREAMNAFGSKDRPINAQLLGTRLSKLRGRIVGGLSFEDSIDTTRDGARLWKVVRK
jgi:putative DNA primase/helicase